MKLQLNILFLLLMLIFAGCKEDQKKTSATAPKEAAQGKEISVEYATGFSLTDFGDYKILTVENPWPEAERSYRYLLAEEGAEIPGALQYDQKVQIPVERMVVTSTTHISSLEILGEEKAIVGFPELDHISSERTRARISQGKIQELGKNEAINTEILVNLRPDVVVAFSVDGSNKTFNNIQKMNIPVLFNGDWIETSPLGKAEWIKFFGVFFNKSEKAETFFDQVKEAYHEARELAKDTEKPTVLAGSMYRDQWYLPYGDSWHGQMIKDANAQYLFADTSGDGSLALSFEAVLSKGKNADYWIGPAQFQSYEQMMEASPHYSQFKAFTNKNVYTFSSERGETGGVIFYELGPNRPDLVLKDLISIFHPGLLPKYESTFYKPLKEEK